MDNYTKFEDGSRIHQHGYLTHDMLYGTYAVFPAPTEEQEKWIADKITELLGSPEYKALGR